MGLVPKRLNVCEIPGCKNRLTDRDAGTILRAIYGTGSRGPRSFTKRTSLKQVRHSGAVKPIQCSRLPIQKTRKAALENVMDSHPQETNPSENGSSQSQRFQHPLLRFLGEHGKDLSPLLIMMHDFPDPDAIASGVALEYICEKGFGIQARVAYGGMIGRAENRAMVKELNLRIHKLRSADLKKYHNIALVDTQPSFENNSFPPHRKATIVLDQHGSIKDPWSDFFIVDPECGASCVIMARALLEMGLEIPTWLGTALVYGIVTDTCNFSRAYGSGLIRTYQQIIPHCDMRALSLIQNPPRSKGAFTALGRGIRRASNHRGLLVSHLGDVSHPDMVSMVADFLLSYKQADRSFCTGRYNGRLHMSLRLSKATVSAGVILRDIVENKKDAGGHGMIAGGSIKVSDDPESEAWEKAEQKLTRELLKRLRLPTRKDPYYPFRRNSE